MQDHASTPSKTPDHGKQRLAEAEWRQARRSPGPTDHPAARQPHQNSDGDHNLRGREWEAARPTDHEQRKARVGRH
ncbi:hypothetical protein [Niveispirillum fermenti]|uniref:hypothetical protein n=1 Tax=Niveispirillum fermenti TaxID=1233113 RepID=UPI003A8C76B2